MRWLVHKFGAQLRQVHSEPLPGARRKGKLEGKGALPTYMAILGRERTLKQFLYWLAIIFRRWHLRGGYSAEEYRRGLTQLLLLSFPGAGVQMCKPCGKRSRRIKINMILQLLL